MLEHPRNAQAQRARSDLHRSRAHGGALAPAETGGCDVIRLAIAIFLFSCLGDGLTNHEWVLACGVEQRGYAECLANRYRGFGPDCALLAPMPSCRTLIEKMK